VPWHAGHAVTLTWPPFHGGSSSGSYQHASLSWHLTAAAGAVACNLAGTAAQVAGQQQMLSWRFLQHHQQPQRTRSSRPRNSSRSSRASSRGSKASSSNSSRVEVSAVQCWSVFMVWATCSNGENVHHTTTDPPCASHINQVAQCPAVDHSRHCCHISHCCRCCCC